MYTSEILRLLSPKDFKSQLFPIIDELTHEVEHLMWKVKNLENVIFKMQPDCHVPGFIKNSRFFKKEKEEDI